MCVITAYDVQFLVAGCRGSGAGQQAMCPGRGMFHDCSRATNGKEKYSVEHCHIVQGRQLEVW